MQVSSHFPIPQFSLVWSGPLLSMRFLFLPLVESPQKGIRFRLLASSVRVSLHAKNSFSSSKALPWQLPILLSLDFQYGKSYSEGLFFLV